MKTTTKTTTTAKTVAAGKNAKALAAEYTNGRKAMLALVVAGKGKALLADVLAAGRKAGAKAVRHTLRAMQAAGAVKVNSK